LQLRDRLAGFWLGDENVIYIGKATSLHSRVADYYATPLGNRGPHAGGRWAKTLSADIYVYFAETPRPEEYERALLKSFARGVSLESQQALHDPSSPIPFANLQFPRGAKKRHFVTRASVPRKR
jgi:hypothetical protein